MMLKLNAIKKSLQKNTIRKKVFLCFFISSILVNSISICTYNSTKIMTRELNAIFTNDILLTNLGVNLNSVETSLKSYLTTSHSADLKNYLSSSNRLRIMVNHLKAKLSNDESELLLIDIKNMALTFLNDTDFALLEKRGRDISGYTDEFNEATQIFDYTNDYIDKLKIYEFKENNTNYLQLSNKLGLLQTFNIIAIIVSMIVNIILIFWFAYAITKPIIRLAKAASEIANGNLEIPEIKANTNDEVKTLTVSFNRMTQSIRNQLVQIREKSEIESRLKEQEMQNLKIKSMLNEAELQSLQAQIDPHFMFNTLNACMQLAMFEGAERTQLFIENFSELLRYNLGNIRTPSTILDEAENIGSYIYLLKERFGDKINFTKTIEAGLPNMEIPRMILQPIVENSFIHGISEMTSGGIISLSVARGGNTVLVEIADNGCGMSNDTIENILSSDNLVILITRGNTQRKNNGIGLKNVINRLMLYYHVSKISDIIEIKSKIGIGTKITIKLPLSEPEVS